MRISFHYCLPTAEQHAVHRIDPYTTPLKVKTLYGSRQTDVSLTEDAKMHAHRIHKLSPSPSPIGMSKSPQKRDQLGTPSPKKDNITFTYLLNFTSNSLQSEIEELKIILNELAEQGNALEEERQINQHHYQQLLGALQQECSVMGEKARALESAIVELQIEMSEDEE